MGPQTVKDIGTPLVIQPGVWGEVLDDIILLRPGFEEWWAQLLLAGPVYPFFNVFNHTAIGTLQTDDQSNELDSDFYLISIQGNATEGPGTFRSQFYEIVDEETGLQHMRLGLNDQGLVGTGQRQLFLPHPYKMTKGQTLLCRTLNQSTETNTIQIVVFGVKTWKLEP